MASCPQATLHCRKTTLGVVHRAARAKMAAELHPRSGKLIGLSNSNRTAQRNQPVQEFNHGLVLSREPLRDRDVFTVRIDKKVNKHAPPEREREREKSGKGWECVSDRLQWFTDSLFIGHAWCLGVWMSQDVRVLRLLQSSVGVSQCCCVDVWMLVCLAIPGLSFHPYLMNLIRSQ